MTSTMTKKQLTDLMTSGTWEFSQGNFEETNREELFDSWDEDLARRMCRAVGGDVSFWMRRSLEHERMKLRLKMDELMEKTQEMLEIMEGAKNAR